MVYSTGGAIEASDYNNLIAQLNTVFGVGNGDSGYGGNSINVADIGDLDGVSPGDELTNELWINLRNAFEDCAEHQGTTLPDGLPSVTDIEDGDIAAFFPRLNSSNNIAALTDNRNVAAGLTPSVALTDTRTISWGSFVQHVFSIKFVDSDHARYFFNTGGQIRISASRTDGTATPQGLAWDSILTPANDFIFNRNHYFALTGTEENVRGQVSPLGGAYSAFGAYSIGSIWSILAKRVDAEGANGGNGSEIMIYSNFLDGGTNAPDNVDGTLTSTITESKHTAVFNIDSPIYTTVTHLTSGS